MSARNWFWKTLSPWGAVALFLGGALGVADIDVGTNKMVTHPLGADREQGGGDDDPKRQHEVALAVEPNPPPGFPARLPAAWRDQHTRSGIDTTIGFALFDRTTPDPSLSHEVIWENPNVQIHYYVPPPPEFVWDGYQYDQGVAIGGNGYLYMAANDQDLQLEPWEVRIILLRSTDATTWKLVSAPFGPGPEKVLMSADPTPPEVDAERSRRAFVHYSEAEGSGPVGGAVNKVRFFAILDGGDSIFEQIPPQIPTPVTIAEPYETVPQAQGGSLKWGVVSAVGPEGEDHVAWLDMGQPQDVTGGSIRYRRLNEDMTTWTPPLQQASTPVVEIDDINQGPTKSACNINKMWSFPSIGVDWGTHPDGCRKRRGWVYIAYAAEDASSNRLADIFVARSRDNGATWDPPVRVFEDTENTVQVFPWLVVDHVGRVIVMWVDFRDDPLGNNRVYHVYMRASWDGGFSFEQEQIASLDPNQMPAPSNTTFGLPVFIGDYNYMAVEPDPDDPTGLASLAYPIWCDLRNDDLPGTTEDNIGDIFYAPVRVTGDVFALADFDNDGDVDLVDFQAFQLCYSGSQNPAPPGCERADFDGDQDVDLADFQFLQTCFTGSEAEGQSSLNSEDLPALAAWCEQNLSAAENTTFADTLRRTAAARPEAPDARLLRSLADLIDPRN